MAALAGGTESSGTTDANFTSSYFERNSQLIVTHEGEDSIPAGEITLTSSHL
jgi:hypothetical protein